MRGLGRHLILELWGARSLNCAETVERALRGAVDACGLTLKELRLCHWSPEGITGVAVLSESHISIHTWPEYRYAAVDIFTCGDGIDPYSAIPVLERHFRPDQVQALEITRGIGTVAVRS